MTFCIPGTFLTCPPTLKLFIVPGSVLFRLKFLHFPKMDFPIKKTLSCQEKIKDLPFISWVMVALHVHVFGLF